MYRESDKGNERRGRNVVAYMERDSKRRGVASGPRNRRQGSGKTRPTLLAEAVHHAVKQLAGLQRMATGMATLRRVRLSAMVLDSRSPSKVM